MKFKSVLIYFFLAAAFITTAFTADDVTARISRAMKAGDAAGLSEYFNGNIRLKIGQTDKIYSRSQAKAILDNFFGRNRPADYQITSQRKSGKSTIITGNLKTEEHIFRIYYQLSDNTGSLLMNYLDIQKIE